VHGRTPIHLWRYPNTKWCIKHYPACTIGTRINHPCRFDNNLYSNQDSISMFQWTTQIQLQLLTSKSTAMKISMILHQFLSSDDDSYPALVLSMEWSDVLFKGMMWLRAVSHEHRVANSSYVPPCKKQTRTTVILSQPRPPIWQSGARQRVINSSQI
jgi:hypothetical protein